MAFATRLDKQGQHYGKPLMEALLSYLDATGEGCYLETLKAENVALYKRFSFELKEQALTQLGNLTLYAMHRPRGVIYLHPLSSRGAWRRRISCTSTFRTSLMFPRFFASL